MEPAREPSFLAVLTKRGFALVVAAALTVAVFLILPVMQTIGRGPAKDLVVESIDTAELPPPPPPPEEEQPQKDEPPPEPPKLDTDTPPLDLQQLELALDPGLGGEGAFGDFAVKLVDQLGNGGGGDLDKIFSLSDLDQRPRVIFQRVPSYPPELRKQGRQGTVYVVFTVDRQGKVQDPHVEKSTDPAFDVPAIEAVRQWKFEPGTRNGEKVQFKMRVPITFNAA